MAAVWIILAKTRASRLLEFGNATTLTNWLKRHGVEP
jgi:hypothetical protein